MFYLFRFRKGLYLASFESNEETDYGTGKKRIYQAGTSSS